MALDLRGEIFGNLAEAKEARENAVVKKYGEYAPKEMVVSI